MKLLSVIGGLAAALALLFWVFLTGPAVAPTNDSREGTTRQEAGAPAYIEKPDLIRVENISAGTVVSSPLVIAGRARGTWFFEAGFPVLITDSSGTVMGEGVASAQGEWMTEDFVPFTATLAFSMPNTEGKTDSVRRGTLILKNDNPSGLPENDLSLNIPIVFGNP